MNPEKQIIGAEEKQMPNKDKEIFEGFEKDIYNIEMGSKEEDVLYKNKFSYIEKEIPRINSPERGYFLISNIGANEEYTGETRNLREQIELRMVEIAETKDELMKIFNSSLPASPAKGEVLKKIIEKNDDIETLWEIGRIAKERTVLRGGEEEKIKNMAIRKMISLPNTTEKDLFNIKIMFTEEGSEEEKMIEKKLAESKK